MNDDIDPEEYLRRCITIEPLVLEEEFIKLPAELAYWNERYASAYRYYLERKLISKQVEATLKREIRDQLEAERSGRITISQVESELTTDPSYVKAKTLENEADAAVVRLKGIVDTIRAKKEMLISLGAHIRLEMANDPTIRRSLEIEREVSENR